MPETAEKKKKSAESPSASNEAKAAVSKKKAKKSEKASAVKKSEKVDESKNTLTATMEDYLEAIYHLVNEHGSARSRMIVERLGVHKSTVTTALQHLASLGFIEYAPYQEVTLTTKGIQEARGVVRRHEIFFRLLRDLLEVESKEAEELACVMEHSLPPHIVDQFAALVEKALQRKKGLPEL